MAHPTVRKHHKGFTLIEVMSVVAIIGILSAIAIPAYSNYVTRSRITDAISGLSSKNTLIEQYFGDQRTYAGAPQCNVDSASSPYFDFSCPAANQGTATNYKLQAVGKGQMAGFIYTIDQSGVKTSTIASPAKSDWIGFSNVCWITNVGRSC